MSSPQRTSSSSPLILIIIVVCVCVVAGRQAYTFGYNFQTGGNFEGYSPHNIKCYEQHSAGCYDVGKPSPNLDDPDTPFNP